MFLDATGDMAQLAAILGVEPNAITGTANHPNQAVWVAPLAAVGTVGGLVAADWVANLKRLKLWLGLLGLGLWG